MSNKGNNKKDKGNNIDKQANKEVLHQDNCQALSAVFSDLNTSILECNEGEFCFFEKQNGQWRKANNITDETFALITFSIPEDNRFIVRLLTETRKGYGKQIAEASFLIQRGKSIDEKQVIEYFFKNIGKYQCQYENNNEEN